MGSIDSDEYKPQEFLFEYDPEKGFDYETFVKLSTNIMYDFFEDTDTLDIETEDDIPMEVDLKDTDYGPEIEEMFRRMEVPKLNGKKNAVYVRPMTYINAVVSYTVKDHKGRDEEHIGTFPLGLNGTLIIYPKGLTILT